MFIILKMYFKGTALSMIWICNKTVMKSGKIRILLANHAVFVQKTRADPAGPARLRAMFSGCSRSHIRRSRARAFCRARSCPASACCHARRGSDRSRARAAGP